MCHFILLMAIIETLVNQDPCHSSGKCIEVLQILKQAERREDEDPCILEFAKVRSLGIECAPALISIFNTSHHKGVLRGAASLLGQYRTVEAMKPFKKFLSSNKYDNSVSCFVLSALLKIDIKETRYIIEEILTDPSADAGLKLHAVTLLGDYDDPESIKFLEFQLDNENPYIKMEAAHILSQILNESSLALFISKQKTEKDPQVAAYLHEVIEGLKKKEHRGK